MPETLTHCEHMYVCMYVPVVCTKVCPVVSQKDFPTFTKPPK